MTQSRINSVTCSRVFLRVLGDSGDGGGSWERSVLSPACTRMGFSVCLVWSRPSHLHSVESSGSPQCKCVCDVWLSVFLINSERFITARCVFCSWWNFDRKCSPSSLPSRKTKTFRQTRRLSIGTRSLSPSDYWCDAGEESFTCLLTGQTTGEVSARSDENQASFHFLPQDFLGTLYTSLMLKNQTRENTDSFLVSVKLRVRAHTYML